METTQTASPSYETVWAVLQEVAESQKDTDRRMKETDRLIKELRESHKETAQFFKEVGRKQEETAQFFKEVGRKQEETDRQMKETSQFFKEVGRKQEETDRQMKETSQQMGGLHNSMGDLVETLFAPHLGEKFDVYNYNLKRQYHRVPIYDDNIRMRTDIDILLSNTTVCMAVEVKRWLETTAHVDEHIKRMQLIRQYPPAEVKGKKLLGAIVGAVVTPEAREYAEQNGFFVLELTGYDIRLLEPPKDFQPKEW